MTSQIKTQPTSRENGECDNSKNTKVAPTQALKWSTITISEAGIEFYAMIFGPAKQTKIMLGLLVLIITIMSIAPAAVLASPITESTTDDFGEIWEVLIGWTQGVLGRIIALTMIVVGIVSGVARQAIMPLFVGLAAGMSLFYAPEILNSILME